VPILVVVQGRREVVDLNLAGDIVVSVLAAALARLFEVPADATLYAAEAPLPAGMVLIESDLRAGAAFGLGEPVADGPVATDDVVVAVVGGPSAGGRVPFKGSEVRIGRSRDVHLRVPDDKSVGRVHASVGIEGGEIRVTDLGSANGTSTRGKNVAPEGTAVQEGDIVQVGGSLVSVVRLASPLLTVPAGSFRRVQSINAGSNDGPKLVLVRPRSASTSAQIVTAAAVPVALAALAGPGPRGLGALGALAPMVLSAGSVLRRRRACDPGHEGRTRAAVEAHERALRATTPDPAQVVAAAEIPTVHLWSRLVGADARLRVRVGVGPTSVQAVVSDGQETWQHAVEIDAVPVEAGLAPGGSLSVSGPTDILGAALRSHLGQVAAFYRPDDVAITVLSEAARAEDWRGARWLPHRGRDGSVLVTSPEAQSQRLQALRRPQPGLVDLVVGDLDPGPLRDQLVRLMAEKPLHLRGLWAAHNDSHLPGAATFKMTRVAFLSFATLTTGGEARALIVPDGIPTDELDRLGRGLGRLLVPGERPGSPASPALVTLRS